MANLLLHESSPYLLQHAQNPVDWHAWNTASLERAQRENKLIIVSIGYAACHWCHVMEHESFEDPEVAEVMNAHFVCIKVDREERPDIDQVYIDAVQLMTGHGGWPLNCVTLPDGRPIWGGTYFRKQQWVEALEQLAELWRRNPDHAREYAGRLTDSLQRMDALAPVAAPNPFAQDFVDALCEKWKGSFDLRMGGYNRAPKFVMPSNWVFLLREGARSGDGKLKEALLVTLERVAWGGIYDHLGGGWARYSVDGLWKVPHFEKMTYDQGQLLSLYAEAHRHWPSVLLERVVTETIAFMEREMRSPEGGWYSSLDADSEGVEGKFYVWTRAEIAAVLGNDAGWFCDFFQVTEAGNWEHGVNVLFQGRSTSDFAASRGLTEGAFLQRLDAAKAVLLAERAKRIRPGLDDKVLASWNALMIKGCVDAYRSWRKEGYRAAALRAAQFIQRHLIQGGRLLRNFKDGRASIPAFLDDYALVAESYIALYQVCHDPTWLGLADALVQHVMAHFMDAATGLFYFNSDEDPALIARKMEVMDNVIPASNGIMANVLHDLGLLLGRASYRDHAERMLQNVQPDMPRYPAGYSSWAALMQKFLHPFYEVAITGPQAAEVADGLLGIAKANFLLAAASAEQVGQPALLDGRFVEGKTLIYVCQDQYCHLPVEDLDSALDLLGNQQG